MEATATELRSKTFLSRCLNQTLTLKPERKRKNPEGDTIATIPAVRVEFEDHQATIEEDAYGRVLVNGKAIDAEVTETDGSQAPVSFDWIIDRLLGNPDERIPPHHNLNAGDKHDSFWEDKPQVEEEPKLEAQLASITRAVVNRDVDALEAITELERQTHNREIVLAQAKAGFAQLAEEN